MTDLYALRDVLDKATGPSRELDAIIFWAFADHSEDDHGLTGDPIQVMTKLWGGSPALWSWIPQVTSSIDAALALVERLLPGWETCNVSQGRLFGDKASTWYWEIWNPEYGAGDGHSGCCGESAPTAPLAILKATLAALTSVKENENEA